MKNKIIVALLLVFLSAYLIFEHHRHQSQGQDLSGEIVILPEEFIIYQHYLDIIGGKPSIADTIVIEATVISIKRTELYVENTIYPKDMGVVRVDKILSYSRYPSSIIQPVDQPSKTEQKGKITSGYGGEGLPESELPKYERLQEGQEVPTLFLLTVRPVKVRYVPLNESLGSNSTQTPKGSVYQTIRHLIQPTEKIFKPIPKEGDLLVFTTKIEDFSEVIEKILPGLEVGSKFRAEVRYNGVLYVEEYEIIP